MTLDHETRYIVLAPDCTMTADQLVRTIHTIDADVIVKETCFGAVISGKTEAVRKVLTEVRKMDPTRIYSKVRGFPVGDQRRCRAHHGSRPGFAQLEKEWKDLTMVEKGLQCLERGEKVPPIKKKGKMPVKDLKTVFEGACP